MKEQQILFEEAPNKRTVRINANTKNFKELAKMFRKNSRHLDFAKIEIAENIAKKGAEYLKEVTPGEILKSAITVERKNDSFYIRQDHPQAMFAEYGTGTLGEQGPKNPDKPSGWEYNVGPKIFTIDNPKYWKTKYHAKTVKFKKGLKVWFVPKGATQVSPSLNTDIKYGKAGISSGQIAGMQMYNTRRYIKKHRTALAKEVIREILEKE